MNIQSEVEFFGDLGLIDQSRFILRLIVELTEEAKLGTADSQQDASRLKATNEMNQRLARFGFQLLSEDPGRPQGEVIIRMVLGTRADKQMERMIQNAYRRVLTGFESGDTTVLLGPR